MWWGGWSRRWVWGVGMALWVRGLGEGGGDGGGEDSKALKLRRRSVSFAGSVVGIRSADEGGFGVSIVCMCWREVRYLRWPC